MSTKVIAKCITCGAKREIKAKEVPAGEMPFCEKCGSIMLAEEAKRSSK